MKRKHPCTEAKRLRATYPDEVLGSLALHVLTAICRLPPRAITLRRIMRMVGAKSLNHIAPTLRQLRRLGLISYEDRKARTIRPQCAITLFGREAP